MECLLTTSDNSFVSKGCLIEPQAERQETIVTCSFDQIEEIWPVD